MYKCNSISTSIKSFALFLNLDVHRTKLLRAVLKTTVLKASFTIESPSTPNAEVLPHRTLSYKRNCLVLLGKHHVSQFKTMNQIHTEEN